jgi:hypothetical protein
MNSTSATMNKDNDPVYCYSISFNRSSVDRITESLWHKCCLLTEKHRVEVRIFVCVYIYIYIVNATA